MAGISSVSQGVTRRGLLAFVSGLLQNWLGRMAPYWFKLVLYCSSSGTTHFQLIGFWQAEIWH